MRGLPRGAVLQRGPPARSLVRAVVIKKSSVLLFTVNFFFYHRAGHKAACKKAARDAAAAPKVAPPTEMASACLLPIEAAPPPVPRYSAMVATCGFCLEAKEKLLLCGKCKVIRYCNADHQRQHWYKRFECLCISKSNSC